MRGRAAQPIGGPPVLLIGRPSVPLDPPSTTEVGSVEVSLRQSFQIGPTAAALLALLALPARAVSAEEIPLKEQGQTYLVLGEINEQVKKYFVVDSGASEVSIPAEVVATLYPETLHPNDFLAGATYRLADGRAVKSERFRLRSLRVGSMVFQDVPASIAEPGAPLLLGQGILRRVGSWRIDNQRKVLVLGEPQRELQNSDVPLQATAGGRTLPPYLPFPVGSLRSEIRAKLGEPTGYKDRGFWRNSTADLFDAAVPDWLNVSYIYDVSSLRVRQSEAVFWNWPSFDGWNSIDYVVLTLERMAGRSMGTTARQAVERIASGDPKAEFSSGRLVGHLERQAANRLYLAVWEDGFHER